MSFGPFRFGSPAQKHYFELYHCWLFEKVLNSVIPNLDEKN